MIGPNFCNKGSTGFEAVRELLIPLRYSKQFDAYVLDRLGFRHPAEPVGFASVMRHPLRDRPR